MMPKTPDEIKKALECCFNVTEQCGECPYYPVSCDKELVRDARVYIRQLEAERDAAVDAMPRWISVKESLPEGEGWVLAIGLLLKKKKGGNYGWSVPHVAEYRHGRWCDLDGMMPDLEDRSLKITHWMPLPEPPKEE